MSRPTPTAPGATEERGPGAAARRLRVRGVVQGVGFRPTVYRLARAHGLAGWVLNGDDGVEIHLEGPPAALDAFVRDLAAHPPPAATVAAIEDLPAVVTGARDFVIRASAGGGEPTVRISPDLATCDACVAELADPGDRRFRYPYVNCTDCGPRYSIVLGLPYDRPLTTMRDWPMCADCAREYHDPGDRRFHAQPVACPVCGPRYRLEDTAGKMVAEAAAAIAGAARRLATGEVLAVKGLGGYHLACDALDAAAVAALRQRKFRKEKPFALMARDLDTARATAVLDAAAETLLSSVARPIVLAAARRELPGVAPGNPELGLMLPSTPLHHLLFIAGAPGLLVMTSANRSSEPIAYRDDEARRHLAGLADAFLVGERPIARRVDDSVVRPGADGPTILRRARGYAPGAVARLPGGAPILALGADLKNTVTLVVDGEAYVSQHVGDLSQLAALVAFRETVADLLRMYRVPATVLRLVHDLHPQYASTAFAAEQAAAERLAVQHHRAHVAAVLAERGELEREVVGVALDGTGYGDDGAIWGGEIFVGSVAGGLARAAHLHPARLPGGDAAARFPVQAAAGFLAELGELPDLGAAPFAFPRRFGDAGKLLAADLRSFPTTSAGRLFDTVAALCGFTREITFEGQAAIWLEHLAAGAAATSPTLPVPFADGILDWRPALAAVVEQRRAGGEPAVIARGFHRGFARGVAEAVARLAGDRGLDTAVASGGVLQNRLLEDELRHQLSERGIALWTHHRVPPNDGGLSLGQAALAALGQAARDQPEAGSSPASASGENSDSTGSPS